MKPVITLLLIIGSGLVNFTIAQKHSPKREFRAVWIATVANIDWPSQKGLSPVVQQAEFRYILDEQQKNGMNAVIVQVRPTSDAFFRSPYEPWSHWLTGKQGQELNPPYDPLSFQITEAHKRGMEFHAWFNPYRATIDTVKATIHPKHIFKQKPEWMLQYDTKYYFNPGIPEVREYIVKVLMDVVRRYDLDGVHFDDYFYPYPTSKPFPDDSAFVKHPNGFTNREDWRRNNVNVLIKMISDSLHAVKPHLKFGISPFGIWKNKTAEDPEGSDTRGGITNYYHLYADVRSWLQQGWIDYNVPQVYFHMGHPVADYTKIVEWWSKNSFGRHNYIGQGTYKVNQDPTYKQWSDPTESGRQIQVNRKTPAVHGSVYFSSKSVMANPNGVQDTLRKHYYRYPALIPAMPWKDKIAPLTPNKLKARSTPSGTVLTWIPAGPASDGDLATYYVIYRTEKGSELDINNPAHILAVHQGEFCYIDEQVKPGKQYIYVVTAVDRLHNESGPSKIIKSRF